MRLSALCLLSALAAAAPAAAQPVDSGPKAGAKAEPLKAHVVVGEPEGKEIDVTAERKGLPTVVIFVRADAWDRPMARFLKALDQDVTKADDEARVVAVWLTDDATKSKEYLPLAQQSLQFINTRLTVYEGQKIGPDSWGLDADAHLTAVVLRGGKVVKSFGFRSLNETDAPAVLRTLKK
jgi:hypothetical protein